MPASFTLRAYAESDAPACLAIFDSNTPDFFAPGEREELASFLTAPRAMMLVAEDARGEIIGVGGYYLRDDRAEGALAWGMVRRAWHRRGVGRALLEARLDALWRLGAPVVSVRTSQHSRGFFERAGFAPSRIVADGFAPGIDLVELRFAPPPSAPTGTRRASEVAESE